MTIFKKMNKITVPQILLQVEKFTLARKKKSNLVPFVTTVFSLHLYVQNFGTHVEQWTSPLFYTRFHTLCTFMDQDHGPLFSKNFFYPTLKNLMQNHGPTRTKKSCPIEQDIVLTGSMIVHEISMQQCTSVESWTHM